MKLKNSKRGIELSMNAIIIIAILLIVMVVVIAMFSKLLGKEAGQIEDQISSVGDEDNDNVVNMFDKCPCQAGDSDNDGCPIGVTPPTPKPKKC